MAFYAGFAVFLALLLVLVVSIVRYSRRLGKRPGGRG
jgi:membrane protein implicated in regulation of membrane protease activity